jgi:glycosyltransferase involved in cell wall biosynthesis
VTSVSVALCTHEGERFVGEQVESILAQTVVPDELVVSDDASTDRTIEIVEGLLRGAATSLRVLNNESPLGVVANFQQAITSTTGDIVLLSDQDDRWHPDRVARTLELFRSHPSLLLVHSDATLVDAEGEPLGRTLFDALRATSAELGGIAEGRAFEVLLHRNLALGASMAVRRSLLAAAVPFPPSWVHDEWLAIVAAAQGPDAVAVVTDPLLDYRQHGANQIGVRASSAGARLSRLRESRTARNRRLLAAAEALRERLGELDVEPDAARRADVKLAHERARSAYPQSRLRRIVPVLAEWRTGRYASAGHGIRGAIADLLQPAG